MSEFRASALQVNVVETRQQARERERVWNRAIKCVWKKRMLVVILLMQVLTLKVSNVNPELERVLSVYIRN